MPTALLESVIQPTTKVKLGGCNIINLTPYDADLECVCLKWHVEHTNKIKMPHLSLSLHPNLTDFVQKKVALLLMKDFSEKNLEIEWCCQLKFSMPKFQCLNYNITFSCKESSANCLPPGLESRPPLNGGRHSSIFTTTCGNASQ